MGCTYCCSYGDAWSSDLKEHPPVMTLAVQALRVTGFSVDGKMYFQRGYLPKDKKRARVSDTNKKTAGITSTSPLN